MNANDTKDTSNLSDKINFPKPIPYKLTLNENDIVSAATPLKIPPTYYGHFFTLPNLTLLTMAQRDILYKIHKYIEFIIYTYISCSGRVMSSKGKPLRS